MLSAARRRAPILLGTAAAVVLWVLQFRDSRLGERGDLPVYAHVHRLVALGEVPYVDFRLEYPPGAAALFWAAGAPGADYAAAFSALMLACLVATLVCTVGAVRTLGLGRTAEWTAAALVALVPVLAGPIVHTRYDLALTALLAAAVWAVAADRWTTAWTLVGVAVVVKLVPLAVVPVLAVAQFRGRRPAEVVRSAVPGAVLVVAGVLPFAVASPSGAWQMVAYHLDRPLQIESLGASVLLAAHHLAGLGLVHVTGYGSDNLVGGAPDAVSAAGTLAGLVVVVGVLWAVRRAPAPDALARGRLAACGAAATLTGLVATGKVLSPQYLLWLVPLVVVAARPPWLGAAVLGAAMVLSGMVYPDRYRELTESFAGAPVALLVVRNALLVVLVVLVWPRGVRPDTEAASVAARTTAPPRRARLTGWTGR